MKFTTARRLIKEHKKGASHDAALIQEAHRVCHEYHDKVSRGKAAEAEIAQQVKDRQKQLQDNIQSLIDLNKVAEAEALAETQLIPDGMSPEEFAKQQVKSIKNKTFLRHTQDLRRGVAFARAQVDTMGNKPIDDRADRCFAKSKVV